jgi:hypothetical protein
MKVTTVLYEDLEPGAVPGFVMRIHAIGTGFRYRAAPLLARVGEQPVEEIFIAPDGKGFSGFLAEMPGPEDRLFVRYMDEPEIEVREEDLEPPVIA